MVWPTGLRPRRWPRTKLFVDHHHARGSSRVLTGEVTARSDRDPQRGEVAGADIGEPRGALLVPVPGSRKKCDHVAPLSGTCVDDAAAATPGTERISLASCSWNAIFRSAGRSCETRSENTTDDRPLGIEADVDRGEISERLDEQQGGEDQHQRDRDLRNHEAALKSRSVAIDGHAARSLPHDGQRIDGRYTDGREQPEQDRGHGRGCTDERHETPVSGQVERDAVCRRAEERHQRPAREQRDRQGQDRAGRGDQQALDQHLRHQPPPRRADGDPHGDLASTGAGAREHERREISAGDEEDQPGQPQQQGQRRAVRIAETADAAAGRSARRNGYAGIRR